MLTQLHPCPVSRLRLVFFPHAGGGAAPYAAFLGAAAAFAEVWTIKPPGRESRLDEAPLAALGALTGRIEAELAALDERQTVLLGVSFGALLAHELAAVANARVQSQLRRIVAVSAPAPCRHEQFARISHLPAADMVAAIGARYGGLCPNAARDPAFLNMTAPSLRADLAMWEAYRIRRKTKSEIPLSVWAGRDDMYSADDLSAWQRYYADCSPLQQFPDGHFFLQKQGLAAAKTLRHELTSGCAL